MTALQAATKEPSPLSRFVVKSPRAIPTPPIILTKSPVVVRMPPKFTHVYDALYKEKHRSAARIVRSVRKARNGNTSVSVVTRDAIDLLKRLVAATKTLVELQKTLPENEQTEYPKIQIGWRKNSTVPVPVEASFSYDIIRIYKDWIKIEKNAGNDARAQHLRERMVVMLRSLAAATKETIDTQKANGLWLARVNEGAIYYSLNSVVWEVCCQKLETLEDCIAIMVFFEDYSKAAQRHSEIPKLTDYQIAKIARKARGRLERLSKGVR